MSSTTPRPSSCASNPRRPVADGCSTAGASSRPRPGPHLAVGREGESDPPLGKQPLEWTPSSGRSTARSQEEVPDAERRSLRSETRPPVGRSGPGERKRDPRRAEASRNGRSRGWRRWPRDIASAPKPRWPSKWLDCPSTLATRANGYGGTSLRAVGRCFGASTRSSSSADPLPRGAESGVGRPGKLSGEINSRTPRTVSRDSPPETYTERGDERKEEFEPAVEAAGIVETTTENEATPATSDRRNPRNKHTRRSVSPSVDHGNRENEPKSSASDRGNRENEPTAPPVAKIARPRLPLHRDVVSAMILVVLFVAWLWTMPALLSASPQKGLRIEPGGSAGGAGSTPATQVLGCNTSRNLQNEATIKRPGQNMLNLTKRTLLAEDHRVRDLASLSRTRWSSARSAEKTGTWRISVCYGTGWE